MLVMVAKPKKPRSTSMPFLRGEEGAGGEAAAGGGGKKRKTLSPYLLEANGLIPCDQHIQLENTKIMRLREKTISKTGTDAPMIFA